MTYIKEVGNDQISQLFSMVRTPISLGREYGGVEHHIQDEIPKKVADLFPLFSTIYTLDDRMYNSGGRGLVFSTGGKHYRAKGTDIDGSQTILIGSSSRNRLPDVLTYSRNFVPMVFDTDQLKAGGDFYPETLVVNGFEFPFGVMPEDHCVTEFDVSEIQAYAYQKRGFNKPYVLAAEIGYPGILWQGEPTFQQLYELPGRFSDLRFQEWFMVMKDHLIHANEKQLRDIYPLMEEVILDLTSWYGFLTKVQEDNHLAPPETSHVFHNYIVFDATETELGIARCDHVVTLIDKLRAKEHAQILKGDFDLLTLIPQAILVGLRFCESGEYNSEQFLGPYHMATLMDVESRNTINGFVSLLAKAQESFDRGYNQQNPKPINKKKFSNLLEKVFAINIDEEKEARIGITGTQHVVTALQKLLNNEN